MTKLKALPDLAQLKKWGSLDSKSYKNLISALEKNQKVLVIAPRDSGKNTLQHAIVNHLHRLHKEPFVIPSIEGIPVQKFKSNAKMKNLTNIINGLNSYVASIQYNGSSKSDISDLTFYLLPHFDFIIDLRNLDGERVVCNIIKGRTKANYVYSNPKFEKYLAA